MLISINLKYLYAIYFLLSTLKNVHSEFYSSIDEMSKVFLVENKLLRQMQKFVVDNENTLDFLRARLDEFEREHEQAIREGETYLDSPLNKYLHAKRLILGWQQIENIMSTHTGKIRLETIERLRNELNMQDDSELVGAIEGLVRLQVIYRLRTKDLAVGLIDGVQYNTKLSSQICFDIAQYAIKTENERLAHSWLMEALSLLENNAELSTLQLKAKILAALFETKVALGDFHGINETYHNLLQEYPTKNIELENVYENFVNSNENKFEEKVDLSEEHEPVPSDFSKIDDFERYRYTCNGMIQQTPSEERILRCGYLTETHPFLIIAPIKVEELNLDPLLVVFYDVISDAEIATVRNLTNNKLQRAEVVGANSSIVTNERTSQSAYIPVTTHKVLLDIDTRVSDMTNLNMKYAEQHQFANYGIGGHYAQHMDTFPEEAFESGQVHYSEFGNRIATVLFYLTDVEQGGGTAFPIIKRHLLPKKGAAAFWFNLHASGVPDIRTLHGACPIICGSKWVQNRWIREYIQADRRPCELWNDSI